MAVRVPERVKDWLVAGWVVLVVMVMVVGGVLLTVLDCLTAGLGLFVLAAGLLTVLCLTAGLGLEVVGEGVVAWKVPTVSLTEA